MLQVAVSIGTMQLTLSIEYDPPYQLWLFNKCTHSGQGFDEGVLQVALFTVLWFKWSVKKGSVAKVLLAIWEIILHENNRNQHSYRFITNLLLSSFCSFLQTKNKNQVFSKLVVWYQEMFLFFVNSESCSTSKPCWIQ